MPLTFYDAFHGVGGFRYGLEQAGWKCIGGCEIDRFACQAYGVINDEECQPTDIRTVDPIRLPDFDCFIFGWPCQDNSIAGKREGQRQRTEYDEGNRSGLLFEAARIMRVKKPSYFIAENVEGLFSVNDGLDFYQTVRLFTKLGYDCQWQLLNTRWFLPQNRERIFFVGHLRGTARPEVFPFVEEKEVTQPRDIRVVGRLDVKGDDYIKRVYDIQGIAPSLPTMQGGGQIPKILVIGNVNPSGNGMNGQVFDTRGISPTLTTNKGEGIKVLDNGQVRNLTPLECFRLQGYPDEWFYKCKEAGISDSQLYKMAGNGVSSPVAREIALRF